MASDHGPDTGGPPANPVPDIPGTLGIHPSKEPVWAMVWSLAPPDWAVVRHPDMPKDLHLSVRVAPTDDGLAVVAAQVERKDGRPVTAQDLRRVKLPPAWVLASSLRPPVTSPRPGPRGKGDGHWRAIFDLWVQAQQMAPRTPIRWMLTQRPGVSDATMRRWVKRARERAEVNGWKEQDHDAGN